MTIASIFTFGTLTLAAFASAQGPVNGPSGFNGCPTNKSSFALTFDDGPGENTPALLKILADAGVKATFFAIGINVATNPDYLKQVYDRGHVIGSHTYTHPDIATLSQDRITAEMQQTDSAILQAIGRAPRLFRYPYGSYSNTGETVIRSMGKTAVYWNVDTVDWQVYDKNPRRIFDDMPGQVAAARATQGIISLQHSELYTPSLNYVARIIDWAKSNGFSMVTVPECIGMSSWYIMPDGTLDPPSADGTRAPAPVIVPTPTNIVPGTFVNPIAGRGNNSGVNTDINANAKLSSKSDATSILEGSVAVGLFATVFAVAML